MTRTSAGLLVHRRAAGRVEVLIAHMGGPFWARKDAGAWSIVKGEHDAQEEPRSAALREFEEETGLAPPAGPLVPLGTVRQAGGKVVAAFAVEGDLDAASVVSNTVELEWPRGSGRLVTFPEIDRAEWVDVDTARVRLVAAQVAFLDRLLDLVGGDGGGEVVGG